MFCVAGGLLLAGLFGIWFLGSKKPLTEQAKRIARLNDPEVETCWLSPNQILVVSGVLNSQTFKWRGHAEAINMESGRSVPMGGLTSLMNRAGSLPGGFKVSPGGKRLLVGLLLGDIAAAEVTDINGAHSRMFGFSDSLDYYWLDSTHALYVDGHQDEMGIIDATANVHYEKVPAQYAGWKNLVAYVGSQPSDRRISKESTYGRALLARSANVDPWALIRDDNAASGDDIRIAIYSTREGEVNAERRPLRTIVVKCPPGLKTPEIFPSPRRDRILYEFRFQSPHHPSPLDLVLRRLVPGYRAPIHCFDSIWVSDADGRNMHEIGSQPVKSLDDNKDLIQSVQLSPDGRQVSFVLAGSLYILPIH